MKRMFVSLVLISLIGLSAQAALVHHWTLDETDTGVGATIADSVGTQNGIVRGTAVTPAPGFEGGSLFFTGDSGEYISVPGFTSSVGLGDISVTFWMKLEPGRIDAMGSWQRLVSAHDGFEVIIHVDSSVRRGKLANNLYALGSWENYVLSTEVLPEGRWIHVACTASLGPPGSANMQVYIDGEFNEEGLKADDPWDGPEELRFAFRGAGGGAANHFRGWLDDIKIFNHVLTPEEIRAMVPESTLNKVTGVERVGDDVVVTWDSTAGYVYSVVASDDLTDEGALDVLPPFTNLPGVAGYMTATTAAAVSEAYLGVGYDVLAFLDEDFEDGAAGWTHSNDTPTPWELGTPNFSNANGTFAGAASGVNAWATDLDAAYPWGQNVNPKLQSPVIDLAGLEQVSLYFNHMYDLEEVTGFGDFGYVNILDAAGTVLAEKVYGVTGTSADWTQVSVDLSAFANEPIRIEFELYEDNYESPIVGFFGWAIDDVWVAVEAPPPPPPPPFTASVTRFVLVDSAGAVNPPPELGDITEGSTFNLDTLGVAYSNVNVYAEADETVGSIRFNLSGATVHDQTESVAPYYLFGDTSGDPVDGTLSNGVHVLVGTPWSGTGASGQTGTNLTVNFTITHTGP